MRNPCRSSLPRRAKALARIPAYTPRAVCGAGLPAAVVLVMLAQRLIELRKDNWELAAYPLERHGFARSDSWLDEYKRVLKLFEQNLK